MNDSSSLKASTPEALVENVMHLISLPEVYLRLQQVLDNPNHTRQQVADVIAYDPALSARVLRISNSSYYGFPNKIDSISIAVTIIGEIELRNIVLATTVVKTMSNLPRVAVDIDEFWLHSVSCGVIARLVAKLAGGCNAEILFLCGMLHDLGILILYRSETELANSVIRKMNKEGGSRDNVERELLGFDHAMIGGLLGESWGLTELLQDTIKAHHRPELATKHVRESQILCLANMFSQPNFSIEQFMSEDSQESRRLADTIGVDINLIPQLIEDAQQQSSEIQSIICD